MNPYLLLIPLLSPAILGALLPVLTRKKDKAVNIYTFVVTTAVTIMTWLMIFFCDDTPVDLIEFTNDFTMTLKFDGFGRFFAGIAATLWPLTVLYGIEYMKHEERKYTFFGFFLIAYSATLGITMAENLFTLYCFYELLTLSTVPLVMHTRTKEAIRAARFYFAISLAGAAFAFVSMIYVVTGAYENNSSTTTQIFYLLGFFGFGVKAAIFPLHVWLPKASVAPTPVTALLHAVAVVKSGVFAIIRLTYSAYGPALISGGFAQHIAMIFVIITIVYGSSMALKETHFKRRLAYSTVANLSYILFGVLLLTPEGLAGGLLHMAFHAEIKILLFFGAGAVLHMTEKEYIKDLNGFGRKMKVTFGCFLVGSLALIGIPPFSGFVSKWYLLSAALETPDLFSLIGAAAILISAFLTAMYCLTVIRRAYFPEVMPSEKKLNTVKDPNWFMIVPMVFLAVSILLTGLFSGPILNAVTEISTALLQ